MLKQIQILFLLFFFIFSNTLFSKMPQEINFSKEEIDYLYQSQEDLCYVSYDVKKTIKSLSKKEVIHNPQTVLLQLCQACQNNWKVLPIKVSREALHEISDLLNKNQNKLTEKKYKEINSVLNEYKEQLESKEAQFFFKLAKKEDINVNEKKEVFNILVVKDILKFKKINASLIFGIQEQNQFEKIRFPIKINFNLSNSNIITFTVFGLIEINNNLLMKNPQILPNSNNDIHSYELEKININNETELIFSDKSGNILDLKFLILDYKTNKEITFNKTTKSSQSLLMAIDDSGNFSTKGSLFADETIIAGTGIATTGNLNINSGNLELTNSTSSDTGNITKNGDRFIHNFGTNNTFAGINSGNFTMTGTNNSGFGINTLTANTIGSSNVAIGFGSLDVNTSGTNNVAIGFNTLGANTSSNNNTAIGTSALSKNVAALNTAVGSNALVSNTTGGSNTALGFAALSPNILGSNNCAVGSVALGANTTGSANVALGDTALGTNITGNNNIAIGNVAGSKIISTSNNIVIGNTGVGGDESKIRIGTSGIHKSCFISGIRGVTTGFADAINVLIDSTGQLGTISSSIRYKENINDIPNLTNNLMQLHPVIFNYKADENKNLQYGLIAEEVDKVVSDLVTYDKDGQPDSVKYHVLPILLLNEFKKLRKKIDKQNDKIKKQGIQILQLVHQISQKINN